MKNAVYERLSAVAGVAYHSIYSRTLLPKEFHQFPGVQIVHTRPEWLSSCVAQNVSSYDGMLRAYCNRASKGHPIVVPQRALASALADAVDMIGAFSLTNPVWVADLEAGDAAAAAAASAASAASAPTRALAPRTAGTLLRRAGVRARSVGGREDVFDPGAPAGLRALGNDPDVDATSPGMMTALAAAEAEADAWLAARGGRPMTTAELLPPGVPGSWRPDEGDD